MYCDADDLIDAVGQDQLLVWTDDEGAGALGVAALGRVNAAIDGAASMIDAYLGKIMDVPVEPTPPHLATVCADIALFRLASRRELVSENHKTRYRDAVDYLKLVSAGKLSIGEDDPRGTPADASRRVYPSTTPPRLFGRRTLEGY